MTQPDPLPVRVTVEDGRLADVHADIGIDLGASLRGTPADLSIAALAARVRAAMPFGVALVGTSPATIASSIRDALTDHPVVDRVGTFTPAEVARRTAGWESFPWQIVRDIPRPPAENIAIDVVLADRVANGGRPPTLRVWDWAGPAIVLGRCQSVANEVDAEAAADLGFAVVRRTTGGGAMFVRPAGAITYSLYLPESALSGVGIRPSYELCDAWAVLGLRGLGMDAHYVPVNDIACGTGKIAGAAQARRRGVVLHHTTMAYDLDHDEMACVLRIGRGRRSDRGVPSAAKVVSPLVGQTALTRVEVVDELVRTFAEMYGGSAGRVSDDEDREARRLVGEKYGTNEWLGEFL